MALPVLAQIGIPALIKGLAEGLKSVPSPAAQGASAALGELSAALGTGQVSAEQMAEVNRHLEKLEELDSAERQSGITEVNESLRAEVGSSDPYVRRMRPTFGYIIAATWGAQMMALAYVIVFDTKEAGVVIESMNALGTIWTIGLSVMGIYVYRRSSEKLGDRIGREPMVVRASLSPEKREPIGAPSSVRGQSYND